MKITGKRLLLLLAAAVAAALAVFAFRPAPVAVDLAAVARGPLAVTLDEEGETRVRDRVTIAAPVAGHLARIALDEGDRVKPGQTVARLATLPLDPRRREQGEALVRAAEASEREAAARVREAKAALAQARLTLARTERLAAAGQLPAQELDTAHTAERTLAQSVAAAQFHAQAAASEVASARAALLEPGTKAAGAVLDVRSPAPGEVLRVFEESERVVPAGAPLLEVGEPSSLEVVTDLLSTEAVQVQPGAEVILTGWGGGDLRGRVRRVEPSGFTKVSPLGVEEQRVNVLSDFVDPPGRLGDRFRVETRIVLWRAADVLKVPGGALFRSGDGWAVYRVEDGKARKRAVRLGHRGSAEAEVLAGLTAGDRVILHPGDRVAEGARVVGR